MIAQPVVCPIFVGRSEELAILHDARRALSMSHGSFVLIGGEAGIGKSRLLAQFIGFIARNRRPPQLASAECIEQAEQPFGPFRTLLAEADCVVILVPLSDQTRGLFDDAAFAAMKKDAVLVNAARGAIVDTAALLRALDGGTIGGAALDVTDPEPLPLGHPLLGRDDVIITPHGGSATVETRARMALRAAENVVAFVRGDPLPTPVKLDGA